MKKFEQINKHMSPSKTKPIHKTKPTTIDFLPISTSLPGKGKSYDYEVIVKFFIQNHITLKDFKNSNVRDQECICGKNNWLVWRNDFMYYDTLNKCLINVDDDEELEDSPELEQIDFAVYVCPECGTWSTVISD